MQAWQGQPRPHAADRPLGESISGPRSVEGSGQLWTKKCGGEWSAGSEELWILYFVVVFGFAFSFLS